MIHKLLASLALAFVAGTAGAATYNFDNNGNAGNQPSFSYVVDGLALTVTSGTYNTPTNPGDAISGFVGTSSDLNNWGHISKRNQSDEHVVDGYYGNEVILFDFGAEVVELTSARFRYTTSYSRFVSTALFDFFADGIFIGKSTYDNASNIFSGVQGSLFGIGASDSNTGFKLAGLSADIVPPGPVVPLPAGGMLLLGGLGALAAMRRKA